MALARSEGSIEAAKVTAVATAAALPAQALAMTSVRRPRLISASSFMEKSLLGETYRGAANYTESARANQIFRLNSLILETNPETASRDAGVMRGFAQ